MAETPAADKPVAVEALAPSEEVEAETDPVDPAARHDLDAGHEETTADEPAPAEKTETSAVYEPHAKVATEPQLDGDAPAKPKRRGWWSRG
jgi:ribonuclease E